MHYKRFIIRNYRAISGPLEIDVEKHPLMPIIGVNECGKTTILHALFAFDHHNDTFNDNGRHLRDISNLYSSSPGLPIVSAEIAIDDAELKRKLDGPWDDAETAIARGYLRKRKEFPNSLSITRNLSTREYSIDFTGFTNLPFNNKLARAIVTSLPYTLFFDDFRDSIEEKVEIPDDDDGDRSGWLSILQQLFRQTDSAFSVYDLATLEERRRKTVLAKVRRKLNSTLTREWQNFRLDDSDALQISIDFVQEPHTVAPKPQPTSVLSTTPKPPAPAPVTVIRNFLKLEVIEKDSRGDEHFFFIRDRSKGFFWFFNFVMKLEFNPKIVDQSQRTIYLLDEPGSYLHASAQSKLCSKLRQLAQKHCVIYCTHSHYLLDPQVIPLSSIRVADKTADGNVSLTSIHEHKGSILERRSAFQPIIDALQIKPYVLDLNHQDVLITEGIYDYYALEMFKGGRQLNILPSVGATSIQFYISLMIAWRIQYKALWDNDEAGTDAIKKATETFGELEAKGRFYTLPLNGHRKRVLQHLFEPGDLDKIKATLGLPSNSAFEKSIASWFYSPDRSTAMNQVSPGTRKNFEEVFQHIGF